ncbi:MAG TPA: cytochrome c [Gemmatimonadales bacterium]|nr:cytochrome c [Gemmatimonadales bacterium]
MKPFLLGVAATLVVLVVGALAYLLLGFAEVRGDEPVTGLERTVMRAAVHASVRRHAPNDSDPVPPTEANLIAGGREYLNQCAGCHGTPGKEDRFPNALNPDAPQLPTAGTEYTEAQIFWVAKHGVRRTGMFANGVWDADSVLWPIATFIHRIKDLPPAVRESLAVRPKH